MANESLIMQARARLKALDVQGREAPLDLGGTGGLADLTVSPAGVAKVVLSPAAHAPGSATGSAPDASAALAGAIEAALAGIVGVERVVVTGANRAAGMDGQKSDGLGADGHANPLGLRGKTAAPAPLLPGVKRVIAVASGKGGVGKSTVAANLAAAFVRRGRAVGVLDGDIHGPSLPTLLGVEEREPVFRDGRLQPLEAQGLKSLSIGNLVAADQALAWRGPMVMGALRQLMTDVDWGALDMLLIDTPPGTGDVHLSLAQTKRLDGAVIVSTPQKLALADVRRSVAFFRKVGVPIIGVIENMAWLDGPDGARSYLFGEGGAEAAARALDAPFLGALPIFPDLRIAGDAGTLAGADTAHAAGLAFDRIAGVIEEKIA